MIHENISVSCKLLERSKSNVSLILKTRNKDKTFLKLENPSMHEISYLKGIFRIEEFLLEQVRESG